jgi:DHA1 family bicyclomycin/chloramphenicol resistance-like MFS transporter
VVGILLVGAGAAKVDLPLIVALTFAWLFCFGFMFTLVQSLALANHGEEAGTASALLTSTGYVATTAAGPYFTSLDMTSTSGYGGNILLFMTIALFAYALLVQPWRVKDLH